MIIQQLIVGAEYGADILLMESVSTKDYCKAEAKHAFWETDKAVTVAKDRFEGIVDKMIKSLRVRGNLDCDFLEQDDKFILK